MFFPAIFIISACVGLSYGKDAPLPHYNILCIASPAANFFNVHSSGDMVYGLIPDLLHSLSQALKFTYTTSLRADGVYGALDPKGHGGWTGMVGQLYDKTNNTDFIAADMTITRTRESVMDFTVPFAYYHLVPIAKTGATLDGIKYAVLDGSADKEFLEESVDPTIKAIWANIQANKPQSLVKSAGDGIALAQQDGWAFIGEDAEVAVAMKDSEVPLSKVGDPLQTAYYGFGVKLDSPLRKKLSIGILRLQESGELQQLLNKWGFNL